MFRNSKCSVKEASAPNAAGNFQIVPAAPNRKTVYIYNDTTKTLFIKIGSQAGVDANFKGFPLFAGGVYETPGPCEVEINGIFAAADAGKYASITETF
jgi:hypothetical protein